MTALLLTRRVTDKIHHHRGGFIIHLILVGVTCEIPRVTPRDIIQSNFHVQNVCTCTNKPEYRHPFTRGRIHWWENKQGDSKQGLHNAIMPI